MSNLIGRKVFTTFNFSEHAIAFKKYRVECVIGSETLQICGEIENIFIPNPDLNTPDREHLCDDDVLFYGHWRWDN